MWKKQETKVIRTKNLSVEDSVHHVPTIYTNGFFTGLVFVCRQPSVMFTLSGAVNADLFWIKLYVRFNQINLKSIRLCVK